MDSNRYTLADFRKSTGSDLFDKTTPFLDFIKDMQNTGTYTYRRTVSSACEPWVDVEDTPSGRQKRMLMLASNNYLGLSTRPEIVDAMQRAAAEYGSGMCGAPLLNGTCDLVVRLERKLAELCGKEAAMVFSTGYAANVGTISALVSPRDVLFVDRLSHASILDGCQLSGGTVRSFPHEDMKGLERLLQAARGRFPGSLIVADGVYSMDGDMANLPRIVELARKYGARVMVDEAHALGVLGPHGAGAVDHFGLRDEVDIIMGTFSKSLASTGGFIAASEQVVTYVRHYARPYFFSAAPPPAVAAGVLAALDIIQQKADLREKLWRNIRHLHRGLKHAGFQVYPTVPQSAILALVISPSKALRSISRSIHEHGLYLNSVEYPAVPKNEPRLRIGVMATHSRADMDFALHALRKHAGPERPADRVGRAQAEASGKETLVLSHNPEVL